MIDLIPKPRNLATRIGIAVTVFGLLSACSSKQVINEVSMPEPVEYTDTVAHANPYVDKELEATEAPVEKPITKRVAKSFKAKKGKAKRKNKIEEESVRPVLGSIDQGKFPDEGIMEGAASIAAPTSAPAVPMPMPLDLKSSVDQPLLVSDVVTNWYFLFGVIALGLAGWYSFAKRRGKRGLVFN